MYDFKLFFCLLPVGVFIDAYMMIGNSLITHLQLKQMSVIYQSAQVAQCDSGLYSCYPSPLMIFAINNTKTDELLKRHRGLIIPSR